MGRGAPLASGSTSRGLARALAAATLLVVPCVNGGARAQATSGDGSLLPPDGFVSGWKKAGVQRVFARADLYGHIDGGAEAFLELGFERLTVQRYDAGARALRVELYRMADATAARGIYLNRRGQESRDPTLRARHTASPYQLLLQHERFLLVINNLAGGAATSAAMVKAAAAIVAKLPADVPVEELRRLPAQGLVAGSERILRGTFGLQAIYTLGDGDMLQLGGRLTAVSGVYRGRAPGSYTLIVADYPSAAAARRAFEHIRANLDPLITPVHTADAHLVFRDYQKKYGAVSLDDTRLEIKVGLEQAPAQRPMQSRPDQARSTGRVRLVTDRAAAPAVAR